MRIDATHKPWLYIILGAIAISAIVYVPYARSVTPGGGTGIGLTFGVLALSLMIFAALLSVRKRFPVIRIGRARLWLKAHLWLGFSRVADGAFPRGVSCEGPSSDHSSNFDDCRRCQWRLRCLPSAHASLEDVSGRTLRDDLRSGFPLFADSCWRRRSNTTRM